MEFNQTNKTGKKTYQAGNDILCPEDGCVALYAAGEDEDGEGVGEELLLAAAADELPRTDALHDPVAYDVRLLLGQRREEGLVPVVVVRGGDERGRRGQRK